MKNIFIPLWLILFASIYSSAQDAPSSDPSKARGRVAYFVSTKIPKNLENPVNVMVGNKIIQVTLSNRMASGPVKIPADGIIKLVREDPNPENTKKPKYLILAQAIIPDQVAKALIILTPPKETNRDLVFDTKIKNLASFKGGDYLYINLSPLNMAVELGKATLRLKPGKDNIYHAPKNNKSVNVPVRYSYYHPTHKKWKMLSASTIVLRSTRREICIFSWNSKSKRIDYRGITFPVSR